MEKKEIAANRLRIAIAKKGMSLKQICIKCKSIDSNMSISPSLLSDMQNGKRTITRDKAHVLAKVLNVYEEWLLGNTDAKTLVDEGISRMKDITRKFELEQKSFVHFMNSFGYEVEFMENEYISCVYAIKSIDHSKQIPAIDERFVDGVYYMPSKEMSRLMNHALKYAAIAINDYIEYTK